MVAFPLWFKIFLGWFAYWIITGILKHLSKEKTIIRFKTLPQDKKDKMLYIHSMRIKIDKFLFWCSPLYLFVVPFIIYTYQSAEFIKIMVLMISIYIVTIEDIMYRKSLIKKLKDD
jgi:hypothetical protein